MSKYNIALSQSRIPLLPFKVLVANQPFWFYEHRNNDGLPIKSQPIIAGFKIGSNTEGYNAYYITGTGIVPVRVGDEYLVSPCGGFDITVQV